MGKKKELTLQDILDAMNERFNFVSTQFKKVDDRFDSVYMQLTALHADIKEIRERQKADGEVLDEVRDTLDGVSKAVDKDAVTIIKHEQRIKILEATR